MQKISEFVGFVLKLYAKVSIFGPFLTLNAVFPSLVPEEKSPLKGPKRDQIFGKKGTKKGPKGIKKGTSRGIFVRYFQNLIHQNHNSKTAHYGKRMYNEDIFQKF